jgi:hypothetical protein
MYSLTDTGYVNISNTLLNRGAEGPLAYGALYGSADDCDEDGDVDYNDDQQHHDLLLQDDADSNDDQDDDSADEDHRPDDVSGHVTPAFSICLAVCACCI